MGKSIKSTIIFLFLPFVFFSQVNKESLYYDWFDKAIGQNHTSLYNGKQYFDKEKSVLFEGKHVYFKTDKFLKGNVVYDNQSYYNLDLQYNLEFDDIIVSLKSKGVVSLFKLIKDKVSEFTINEHRFLRLEDFIKSETDVKGFVELLYNNKSIFLVKKYKKVRRNKVKQLGRKRHLYYYFVGSHKYGVLKDEIYYSVNSKSDVVKLFPNLKKQISNYYYENWRLRKNKPDSFMKGLFENVINSSISN
ncbi:hypothetical protein GCM10009430_39510 [Aquimarina litoralis]|uniref:DKNYY family protein n=1 Tax=Aquimarina litoralis TaxID=584605 RepID=A0ABP3UBH3_9FLAO